MRLVLSDRYVDTDHLLVVVGDERIPVTQVECDILRVLVAAAGPVERAELLRDVWGYSAQMETRAVDMAMARLRKKIEPDPSHPQHLVTVRGLGYRAAGIEAVASPSETTSNLGAEQTTFVGRESELAAVQAMLSTGERLITLLGPGGAGKTSLAESIARAAHARGQASWFVDLSHCVSGEQVFDAVARVLTVVQAGDARAAVTAALRQQGAVLVVLDNTEQVIEPAADAIAHWHRVCGAAQFVVTSRVPLQLAAERRVQLGPMETADAVALFVDRARRVQPDFDPAEHSGHLEAIVAELDGMPLAIELAARRIGMLSPEEIGARLEERLAFLRHGPRDAHSRHRSMQATIEWSWELLTTHEQAALCQLSVFRGGFTSQAAEAVIALESDAPWSLEVLQRLVNHSLVHRTSPHRLSLYLSIQEFAGQRLLEMGAAANDNATVRHARWFSRMGEKEEAEKIDGKSNAPRQRISDELDNLLRATEAGLQLGEHTAAAFAARAAIEFWIRRGRLGSALTIATEVLEAVPEDFTLRLLRGRIHLLANHYALASADLALAVELAEELGRMDLIGVARGHWGLLYDVTGELPRAVESFAAALVAHRAAGDAESEAITLNNLGNLEFATGHPSEAATHLSESLRLYRQQGNTRGEAQALASIGGTEIVTGEWLAAEAHLRAAVEIHRQIGAPLLEAAALVELGELWAVQGRLEDAALSLERARSLKQAGDSPVNISTAETALSDLARRCGDAALALAHAERALHLLVGVDNSHAERQAHRAMALAWLAGGAADKAQHSAEAAVGLVVGPLGAESFVARARARFNRMDYQGASDDLDRAEADAARVGWKTILVEVQLERCRLATAAGRDGAALHAEARVAIDALRLGPDTELFQRWSSAIRAVAD